MPILTPSFGVVYEAKFQSSNGSNIVIVQIAQKETFDANAQVLFLTVADDHGRLPEGSFTIKTLDNDEDPYSPIKAKVATFKFFADSASGISISPNLSLSTFANGESDEWRVTAYFNTTDVQNIFFQGFLVMDVTSEPYEPKPYVVTLTATDNLGLLKDIPLTDFTGKGLRGNFKLIQFLAYALSKTNLHLPIYVANNLIEANSPAVPFYESCYIDAKTFEKDVTSTGVVSEDCYTVLTKILGQDSRLMQLGGKWFIERIYEKNANATYIHRFSYDGTYLGSDAPVANTQTIDLRGDIDFINDNAQITVRSPYKKVDLTFNFETPKEIIDNIGFTRGEIFIPLSMPNVVIDGTTYYQKKYHLDDWTLLKDFQGNTPDTVSYITRLFSDNSNTYEAQRYAVIQHSTGGGYYFNRSNKIYVARNDKFDISIDARWSADVFGSGSGHYQFETIQVRLTGTDGSHWTLHGGLASDPNPIWVKNNSSWSFNNRYFWQEGTLNEDLSQWKSSTFNSASSDPCPPIPVDGYLEILILWNQNSSYQVDRYFQNLSFTYRPYIDGGYPKLSGQINTVSQSGNYQRTLAAQLYVSDSPKKLFKGALLRKSGSDYSLANTFYDGQAFPNGVPSFEFLHTFGFHLVYSIWQQYRRYMRAIQSDFYGILYTPDTLPDLQKQYLFTNPNPNVNNKIFMLLKYEQDYDTQIWNAYFQEVIDTSVGYVFSDPYEFKYLS